MYALGFDIGTTNIAGVLLNLEDGTVAKTVTVKNDSAVKAGSEGADGLFAMQDVAVIAARTFELFDVLAVDVGLDKIASIGFTGQMHGIVYLDVNRNPVSHLITWQDRRGNALFDGRRTYAEHASKVTGCNLSAGYGAVTYFYDSLNGLVPEDAVAVSTVYDYIAGVLGGVTENIAHPGSAASIGLYDIKKNRFDEKAIKKLGLDFSFFPEIAEEYTVLGKAAGLVPVTVGIGDNQASFIGAVRDFKRSVLVNVGTGSQVSVVTDRVRKADGIEIRPFVDGSYLAVGSALCGGKSLGVLADLVKDIASRAGSTDIDPYELIKASVPAGNSPSPLSVDTRFSGSRKSPMQTGSITNITPGSLTLENLSAGFCDGISRELSDLYKTLTALTGPRPLIVGSGGGIKKNPALSARTARDFSGGSFTLSPIEEEAAAGAALYGACGAGLFKDVQEATQFFNSK